MRRRGRFLYIDVVDLDGVTEKLCRLDYTGTVDCWEFGFYTYAHERYEPSFLPNGHSWGSVEDCFDCAASVSSLAVHH